MPAQVPMRVSPIVSVVVAVLLLAASASAQEINLSHDLLRLGIGANMEPNRRDLDSRPLFQAAVAYIERRPISRVTLDPGDYYFLTRQENSRYIDIENLRDVAFAFAGVNLYFREASGGHALVVRDSERVTFSGFTIDFLELPFTQVRVAQVQPEERDDTLRGAGRIPARDGAQRLPRADGQRAGDVRHRACCAMARTCRRRGASPFKEPSRRTPSVWRGRRTGAIPRPSRGTSPATRS